MRRRRDHGLNHAEAMQRHACRAMWERHGLVMTVGEYLELCAAIITGQITPMMRDDRGALVYAVQHRGLELYAVWSHEQARIRTLLPCKAWVGSRRQNGRFVRHAVTELRA